MFDESVLEGWLGVLNNGHSAIETVEYRPGNEMLEKYLEQREGILNELVKLVQSGEIRDAEFTGACYTGLFTLVTNLLNETKKFKGTAPRFGDGGDDLPKGVDFSRIKGLDGVSISKLSGVSVAQQEQSEQASKGEAAAAEETGGYTETRVQDALKKVLFVYSKVLSSLDKSSFAHH